MSEPAAKPQRVGPIPARPVEVASPAGLRTERMVLRPLREGDRAAFIAAVNGCRATLTRWAGLFHPGEPDDELFSRQLYLTDEGERTGRALRRIALADDGAIVGAFNLNSIVRGLEAAADINWWVVDAMSGRGLATEGVRALSEHAIGELPGGMGLHAVRAWIARDNAPSIRVANKAGFVPDEHGRTYLRTGAEWVLHDLFVRAVYSPGG